MSLCVEKHQELMGHGSNERVKCQCKDSAGCRTPLPYPRRDCEACVLFSVQEDRCEVVGIQVAERSDDAGVDPHCLEDREQIIMRD